MNEQLLRFIKERTEKNFSRSQIRKSLLKSGAEKEVVDEHLNEVLGRPKTGAHLLVAVAIIILIGVGILFFLENSEKPAAAPPPQVHEDDMDIFNEALTEGNADICYRISGGDLKQRCVQTFSVDETCDQECVDKELLNTAIIEDDPTKCNDIVNQALKDRCHELAR